MAEKLKREPVCGHSPDQVTKKGPALKATPYDCDTCGDLPKRILIVTEHKTLSGSLKDLISLTSDICVAGEAPNFAEAGRLLRQPVVNEYVVPTVRIAGYEIGSK